MHRKGIEADAKGLDSSFRQGEGNVLRNVPRELLDQGPIEIDLGIFIVMDIQEQ